MKKLIILISFLFISSVSAMEETSGTGDLVTDTSVGSTSSWIFQDGSVETDSNSIKENEVISGDTTITDKEFFVGEQTVNMGVETSMIPLSEENIELNSAGLPGENNNGVTMGNVDVNVLPTTGLEESLLILASLFLSGLIIFRNKFIKK
ncbi:hypothetical protein HUU51_03800 [Candidatus Gracilibacteria bacterium]|nr:hypothetical protein [Candidatus Gracilibacteria bacterium]